MKRPAFIIIAIIIYIVTTVFSYAAFTQPSSSSSKGNYSQSAKTGNDYEALTFDATASKSEECPINGAKYSREQKNWWEKHRPLGVMIENHLDARPQSGINAADVTYEAVAEGGITRTLNVYYCQDAGIV